VCTADSCSADVCQHAPLCSDGGGADAGIDAAITDDGAIGVDAARADAAVDGGARRDAGIDGGVTVVADQGCACRAGGRGDRASGLLFFGLVLGVLAARRRRAR
jgi:MYXO-CTERM domain-containing protein